MIKEKHISWKNYSVFDERFSTQNNIDKEDKECVKQLLIRR